MVLSNWRNLRHVKDREFRVRVSEIKAKALIRIASGRSFMVVMSLVVEAFGFGRVRVEFLLVVVVVVIFFVFLVTYYLEF